MRKILVKFIFILAVALGGASLACNRKLPVTPAGMTVYTDTVHGFRLAYPTGWEVTPSTPHVGVSFSATSVVPGTQTWPYIAVTMMSDATGADLNVVIADGRKEKASRHPEFKLVAESKVSIWGHTAQEQVYTYTVKGMPIEFVEAFVEIDGDLYIFIGGTAPQAYAAFEPTFSSVLNSFATIKKSK